MFSARTLICKLINKMYLPKNDFIEIVKRTPLVAIDLCIIKEQKILLGCRNNSPAKSYFFVPGGRIMKNEKIEQSIERITREEIGYELKKNNNEFIGVYEHFYDDNFLGNTEFNTHYIILAFLIHYSGLKKLKNRPTDEQHSQYIWHDYRSDNKHNYRIHPYTMRYIASNKLKSLAT